MADVRGPHWLQPLDANPGGVDFMGLRQPGLTMADELLPGITNTTRAVRYYTVIGWLFSTAKSQRELRLLESAFVHGVARHAHPEAPTGVVGSDALGASEIELWTGLDASRAVVSALDAPFYGPSAQALGVAGRNADGALAPSGLGRELAEVAAIDPDMVTGCVAREQLDEPLVQALGSLCFCTPAAGRERDLLEEVLFRHDSRRAPPAGLADDTRARSLALILHCLTHGEGDEDSILQGLVDRLLHRIPEHVPSSLQASADGFGVMGMRWHFRHAAESAWASVGRLIFKHRPSGCSARPFVPLALAAATPGDPWLPNGATRLGAALDAVGGEAGIELVGHRRIGRAELDENPGACLITAALQLALLARRVRTLDRSRLAFERFLDLQQPWWCPLSALAREPDEDGSVATWVEFVIDRYAIGQHLLTAARKMGDGVDGYYFVQTDDGFRLDSTRFPGEQRNWKTRWLPDAGPTKIPAALALMRNLQLVQVNDERWAITDLGHRALRRVLERADAG